jgi:1,2-phenylacetyl-CoA epoxidase catalytic subunit
MSDDNKRKRDIQDDDLNFKKIVIEDDLSMIVNSYKKSNEQQYKFNINNNNNEELDNKYIETIYESYNDILKYINESALPIAEYLSFDDIIDFTNNL